MADYATIKLELGTIARLWMARPDKRNPIGPATCGELVHALAAIKADASVRVVVLSGEGVAFSAGGDLAQMAAPTGVPVASFPDLFHAMHGLGKPIIARVHGPALAGGLGLMVACDLVVASDAAVFGTTEIAVGLWPMMITAELTRSVGRKKVLEMMLTGAKLTAADALACGLVNRVVPADKLDVTVDLLATELAGRSPAAVALGLHAFYAAQDMDYSAGLSYLQAELGKVLALEDAAEGIAAFLGKRQPQWKGR
ncbi:MAG TPA: enoyl-CoA hydratase-related protein [Kofleriaceae bacterium]|jgi:enoyl-CoA hydratase/carnithine racemase